MAIKIYSLPVSPSARCVLMTLNALELEYEIVTVNLMKGDHKQPNYLAINPRGLIPALQDGDFTICESAAIACYLCNKYEKSTKEQLYPTDPEARGKVDQLLYISVDIFDAAADYMNVFGVLFGDGLTNEAKRGDFIKRIHLIENFLGDKNFLAAEHVTLADFCVSTVLLSVESSLDFNFSDFPKVDGWMGRIKSLAYFGKTHDVGVSMFAQLYKEKLAQNQTKAEK